MFYNKKSPRLMPKSETTLNKTQQTKHIFLYFSMNYRDFSVKSKLIISLFQTVKLSLSVSLFQKTGFSWCCGCVAAVKPLPLHHHSTDYIFSNPLGSFRVSLKTEFGGRGGGGGGGQCCSIT